MKLFISDNFKQIDNCQLMLWSKRCADKKILSIINFIEENDKEIKKSFCDIVDNLNIYKIDKKNFIDYLNIQNSYSSFWCSDFYEKSFYKNPEIINQLKLIALKKFLSDFSPDKVIINTSSDVDAKSIEFLCKSLRIDYVKIKKYFYFNFKLALFFKPILAITKFLKFIFFRISLKKINWNKIYNLKNKKVFFSYSIYTNKNLLAEGLLNSSYWDPLIKSKLLNNILWINIYFHSKNNSLRNELNCYDQVNNLSNHHTIFLEQLFDIKIFLKVIYSYFKILFNVFFLQRNLKKYLHYQNSFFLKHYYIDYFNNSFLNVNFLVSIYYYLLLIKLKNKLGNACKIFYLFENQGWEKSLNFILNNDFKTIAINHASIRNWDMRFVNDINIDKRCTPDIYASNGRDSYEKLIQNNFESKKIIQLEALRYFDLIEKISDVDNINLSSILIVSDVHDEGNVSLEKMLQKISNKKFKSYKFYLKEHLLKKTNFCVNFNLIKTNKKIYELQSETNIAIVSGTTSAAIDLLLLGYELIVPLSLNSLNFSPLKDHQKVTFVNDYNKINEILKDKIEKSKIKRDLKFENNFFKYNSNLENWKKILNETC